MSLYPHKEFDIYLSIFTIPEGKSRWSNVILLADLCGKKVSIGPTAQGGKPYIIFLGLLTSCPYFQALQQFHSTLCHNFLSCSIATFLIHIKDPSHNALLRVPCCHGSTLIISVSILRPNRKSLQSLVQTLCSTFLLVLVKFILCIRTQLSFM